MKWNGKKNYIQIQDFWEGKGFCSETCYMEMYVYLDIGFWNDHFTIVNSWFVYQAL